MVPGHSIAQEARQSLAKLVLIVYTKLKRKETCLNNTRAKQFSPVVGHLLGSTNTHTSAVSKNRNTVFIF